MLEHYLPEPRILEVDHQDLAIPPSEAWPILRDFDLSRSPLLRGLFLLQHLRHRTPTPELKQLEESLSHHQGSGFHLLQETPPEELIVGAIVRLWEPEPTFTSFEPEAFVSFAEPGWAKVAWSLRCLPHGDGSRLFFELRLDSTDEETWHKLRHSFHQLAPFVHFLRHHVLSLLARELRDPAVQEQHRFLPGDDILPEASSVSTQHLEIYATPAEIWAQLLQLQLAETPQDFTLLQTETERHLLLGELFDLQRGQALPFADPKPPHYWQMTWAFVLEPVTERKTRVLLRSRLSFEPAQMAWKAFWLHPQHRLMQRGILHRLKAQSEPRHHEGLKDLSAGLAGASQMLLNLLLPGLRKQRSHWGLTEAEAQRSYPGDERIPQPNWFWTHGIEIAAPPEQIWPWLVQIGQNKAGFYSYQWLENLVGCEIQNADQIHSEWQELTLGDRLYLHPDTPGLPIVALKTGQYFLAYAAMDLRSGETVAERHEQAAAFSWLFYVEPRPAGSRLISRFRSAYSQETLTRLAYGPTLIEPIGFVMDRKMLKSLKELVESRV